MSSPTIRAATQMKLATAQKLIFVCVASLSTFILLATPTFAATATSVGNPLGSGATFDKILLNVVRWGNALAIPLTTLMILVAGYLYLTGGGNADQIKKAHKALIWAVVGFVVILFSAVAQAIIKNVIGA